jgi:hypothetical protein
VSFEVLTVVYMKMTAFWGIAPLNLVEVDGCVRVANCLHHQGSLMTEAVHSSVTSLLQLDYMALYPRKLP